ncbi:hypothetical protein D9M71_534450 [compost metagenome]
MGFAVDDDHTGAIGGLEVFALDRLKHLTAGLQRRLHHSVHRRTGRHPEHADFHPGGRADRAELRIDDRHCTDQHRQRGSKWTDAIQGRNGRHDALAADPPEGWLETKNPAAAGRNPNRATRVGTQAEICQPRRHRSGGTAGGSARDQCREAWIDRGAGVMIDPCGTKCQLMQAGFPGDAAAVVEQSLHHIGMLAGRFGLFKCAARCARRQSGNVDGVLNHHAQASATHVQRLNHDCHRKIPRLVAGARRANTV